MDSSSDSNEESIDYADIHDTNMANVRLTKDNERLTNLVNSLKHQISESCQFVERNAELERNNQKIQAELRSTKLELDDYKNRLEISMKTIEDLKNKQAKEQLARKEIPSFTVNNDREKDLLNQEIKAIKEQINKKNNEVLKAQTELSSLNASINSLLKVSQTVFNQVFENPKKLMQFLINQQHNQTPEPSQECIQPTIYYDDKLLAKIEKLQNRIKNEKHYSLELQTQFDKKREDYENKISEQLQQINKLNSENQDLHHQISLKDLDISQQKTLMNSEIDSLKQKITILTKKNKEQEESSMKNKIFELSGTLKQENADLKRQIQDLKHVSDERDRLQIENKNQAKLLMDQRKYFDDQKETMKKRMDKVTDELNNVKKQNEQLEMKLKSIQFDKDSQDELNIANIAKFKSLESSLAMAENIKLELQSQNQKYARSIKYLEENLENMRAENQKLLRHRDRLVSVVGKQSLLLNNLEKYSSELNSENRSIKDKIIETKTRIIQKEAEKPQVIDIPITAWYSQEFSRELCSEISKIVNSPINNVQKMKSVMDMVGSAYNKQIQEKSKQIQQITEQNDTNKKLLEKVITTLSDILEMPQLSIYYITADFEKAFSEINNYIEKIRFASTQAANSKAEVEDELASIIEKLDVKNKDDAIEMINELYLHIKNQTSEIKSFKKQINQLKKLIKACNSQSDIKDYENQQKIKTLTEENNEKDNEIVSLSRKLKATENSIKILEKHIEDVRNKAKNDVNNAINSNTMNSKSESEKCQKIISEIKETKDKLKAENDDLKLRIKFLENEITQLKGCIITVEGARKKSDEEMSKLLNQFDSYDAKLRAEFAKEKEDQKQLYEKHIEDLKKRSAELANSHTVLSNSLCECNDKISELSKKVISYDKQIDNINCDNKLKIEELNRQLDVANAKIKSISLSKDIEYQNIIDDITKQAKFEKQSLMDSFVCELCQFIDPHIQITPSIIITAVKKASEELKRLEMQEERLRSILSLSNKDCVEDFVSKLVISQYMRK
ncbi:hypothetical protein TVAG_314780 [Trichomonas vaginalis G3]|uniref:Uncharacterized protein n=1 Tax=Trichomonas vaginalis (strain ATCC PRA-98 / G3) TaxID=412133 RepID=A2ETR7_TRIV3|nr:biological adhesion protein [Trichomonas vaginalis G3]EAY03948.1 hypothetical protein TVAG_314780 [Trichomonas vaginalis G3]KAI5541032.1 biological adhesion protein [Trichomonas vaginalis G3]|eukprot:XP_001316171.1 hypothetical protein [Trichomonas vaginalis G3]